MVLRRNLQKSQHRRRTSRHRTGSFFATPIAAGQVVRAAAQEPLVLELLPVAFLLRPPGFALSLPGFLPLLGLLLRFGLSLLGAALCLLGFVAYDGAVGLLSFALRLIHRDLHRGFVAFVALDTQEAWGRYTPTLLNGSRNELPGMRLLETVRKGF